MSRTSLGWLHKGHGQNAYCESERASGPGSGLVDYKLFRFGNGRLVTLACEGRFAETGMSKTYFDEEWNPLGLSEGGHPVNTRLPMPACFKQMKELSDELGQGLPFVRLDWYDLPQGLRFGEITLYPSGGFERFDPAEWGATFGSWIDLPEACDA